MISVAEATERLLSLVAPLRSETVPLRRAAGRVLAAPLRAAHPMPPFPASAMDGYAVAGDAPPGASFRVTGEAAAGRPFDGTLGPREAVRIFTGGAVPAGATRVVIQEDVSRDGDRITVAAGADPGPHVRPAGGDFTAGHALDAPRTIGSRDVALMAAMGVGEIPVARRPVVALAMTGDELRDPGEALGPGAIPASNGYGLAAMVEAAGADARLLPILRDDPRHLAEGFALAEGADLLVTIGGASVGEHDLVASAAKAAGIRLDFHRVAMRPGKPLMAGRSDRLAMLGLPGNPVSSMVCGVIFMLPMVRAMQGLDPSVPVERMPLGEPLAANGPRAHYMRARTKGGAVVVNPRQDSSLLSVLHRADRLVIRPPGAEALGAGAEVGTVLLPA